MKEQFNDQPETGEDLRSHLNTLMQSWHQAAFDSCDNGLALLYERDIEKLIDEYPELRDTSEEDWPQPCLTASTQELASPNLSVPNPERTRGSKGIIAQISAKLAITRTSDF